MNHAYATPWTTVTTNDIPPSQSVFDNDLMIDAVCNAFNVERVMIYEKCRRQEVKYARWMVWKILMSHGYTSVHCGRLFNHDHSTVLNAMNHIDQDIEQMPFVGETWEKVKKYMRATPVIRIPKRKIV